MFGRVQSVGSVLVIVVAVTMGAQPVAAAVGGGSTVSITVPVVQRLEGTTSLTVSTAAPRQQDLMVVKSNISWVLVAHSSGAAGQVAWRIVGQTAWQPVGTATPIQQGLKGVHAVSYEVQLNPAAQQDSSPIRVTFSVEPVSVH